ncbi:MAG TPA: hypothetical protein VGB30_12565 [bacterium]|jgi:hypothetical protein
MKLRTPQENLNPKQQSLLYAIRNRNQLASACMISTLIAIGGSWIQNIYQPSAVIYVLLGFTAGWAFICSQARGFVYGRIFSLDWTVIALLLLSAVSPAAPALLLGIVAFLIVYLAAVGFLSNHPLLKIAYGDRLYRVSHPFDFILPIHYLAPQPLSPVFEPIIAFHWKPALFGIPLPVVLMIDPPAVHDFIEIGTSQLTSRELDWLTSIRNFRSAVTILSLLEWLSRYENDGLDGVALAAAARLALYNSSDQAKAVLREALLDFKEIRRMEIMEAFDLGAYEPEDVKLLD